MQSSLWYPWEIYLFRWTSTVFIYFLASCWWAACTAEVVSGSKPADGQGFISAVATEKGKKWGERKQSRWKNENLISLCFLRIDWERVGFIAAWPSLFQLTMYHSSCSPPSYHSLTSVCVFVCACKGLSICVSDVSFGLEANDVYVTATFCSRLGMLFCSLVSFIHISCCLSNSGKVAVQNNNLLLYLWPKSIWQRYSRC